LHFHFIQFLVHIQKLSKELLGKRKFGIFDSTQNLFLINNSSLKINIRK